MSRKQSVLVGYELGTGKPVNVPLAHTFVAGQTQLSGKTTTLQAIATRSGRRALAFVTKRGEELDGRPIRPFLPREGERPIHWRLVETILASALGQRSMKYERYWIVNAAKNARSLQDVRKNVERLRAKAKGSTAETYELIGEYLDLVLPEMRELNASHELDLQPGLNVIDLVGRSQQLQELVIRASLEQINQHEKAILTVFPEAWKFAPRGRVTPSSSEAIKMAREGAVIGNLLLSDSQDIAGVDTPIRQAASVWMLGKQRELNELKRTLQMIPAGISKPRPADVTSLQLGQFIVCTDEAIRTYVQPAWMDDDTAIAIARGERSIDDVHAPRRRPQPVIIDDRQAEAQPTKTEAAPTSAPTPPPRRSPPADPPTPIEEDDAMSKEDVDRLEKAISSMGQQIARALATAKPATATAAPSIDDDDAQPAEGANGAAQLTLKTTTPVLRVDVSPRELTAEEEQPRGRVATLIADGFFQTPRIGKEAYDYWRDRGFSSSSSRIYEALDSLTKDGFLIRVEKQKYQQHPNLDVVRNGAKKVTLTINYK